MPCPMSSPQLGVVTLSHDTATHLEATLHSVIEQQYSRLRYVVQDEDSHDGSREIIRRSAPHLHAWESARTAGRADALLKGFDKLSGSLREKQARLLDAGHTIHPQERVLFSAKSGHGREQLLEKLGHFLSSQLP